MAQDQQDTSRTGAAAAAQCVSVEDLLKQVTSELNEFEAKKLGELKTDLDGFVKKKTGLVDDYRKKYPQLRDKWCTQHQLIENLYRALQCAFPDPDWKKIVDECICTNLKSRSCKWQTIAHRRRCCRGKLESALAEAQVKFDWAKKHLDALQANAQKVDAEITDDDALIKKISGYVPGRDQAVALYLFWFRLLPSHVRLMPDDLSADCEKFTAENATTLCKKTAEGDCPADDNPCAPPADYKPPERKEDRVPWLLPPDAYSQALDCAWQDYRDAKNDLAQKDAAFKAKPDDIATLEKELKDLDGGGLEAKITDCLRAHKPDDKCCKPEAAKAEE